MEVVKIIDTLVPDVEQVIEVPQIVLEDGVPGRAVLREPRVEQLVDVPVPSFCEYGIVLEEAEEDDEVEEEEEPDMFDEAIDWLEHSSWRSQRLCRPFMAGRCEDGWGCTFAHGEQELHPSTLRAAERGRASAADHGCAHEGDRGAAGGCVNATVPGNIVTVVQIIPQVGVQEEIVEVTQFVPHERIAVVSPVPQFRNKLWESRSFFRRIGSAATWSRSWCASATDFAENVEVTQLVRTAVEQIVAFPMPQFTWKSWRCSARRERSNGADCGLVPQIMEEITDL